MKFEWNRKNTTIAAYAFIVLALAILFSHFVGHFWSVVGGFVGLVKPLYPIFLGFSIAYLLNPIMCWIECGMKKIGFQDWIFRTFKPKKPMNTIRTISLLLTYTITFAVITLFALIVLPEVFLSVRTMATQVQEYVNYAERLSVQILESIPEGIVPQSYIEHVSDMVGESVSKILSETI